MDPARSSIASDLPAGTPTGEQASPTPSAAAFASDTPLRDARFATWSMPKTEWDGYVARRKKEPRNLPLILGSVLLVVVIGVIVTLASTVAAAPTGLDLVATCGVIIGMFTPGFILAFVLRRRGDRWRARAEHLWDEQGCVCPLCLAPLREHVDDPAGCGHGFIVEDQPWVMRYLEALATAPEPSMHWGQGRAELSMLRQRAEKRGTRPRGFLRRAARSVRVFWDHWLGFEQPMWRRVVAHLALGAAVFAATAPFSWVFALTALWMSGFCFMGFRALRSARFMSKRLRCAKCDQTLLAVDRAKPCTECGASLAEPGSVKSAESQLLFARWAMGAGFMILGYWIPTYAMPYIGRALPDGMLITIAEHVPEIAPETLQLLAGRPLSPREQRQLANMMLPHIRASVTGEGSRRAFMERYIAASVANGTLPPEYAETLANAACRLLIEVNGVEVASETAVIELDARRLTQGVPLRVAFRGYGDASSTLGFTIGIITALELDGTVLFDAAARNPAQITSDMSVELMLAERGLQPEPGDREITVRAFTAIVQGTSITMFDETGAPVLPPKSAGPWRIERALTLRVR